MVKFTKDVELTLSVILIARFKSDRLHGKLDLVVVFLLNKFDDAVLSRAKSFTCVVVMKHFFCLQDSTET